MSIPANALAAMGVIGFDLSLTAPGLSVAGRMETLRTKPPRGDRRLCDIHDWINHYTATRKLRLAMIEAVPPYDHASSSLERIHGIARERLARYGIPFAYVNVTALKAFATGNGRADKSEVMDYVERETGRRPDDDNQADAWVLRRMGELFLFMDWEQHDELPPAQIQAMDAVEWPLFPHDPEWPWPYRGRPQSRFSRKQCKHKVVCLKNGDHWLHPFNMLVCDRPPK